MLIHGACMCICVAQKELKVQHSDSMGRFAPALGSLLWGCIEVLASQGLGIRDGLSRALGKVQEVFKV